MSPAAEPDLWSTQRMCAAFAVTARTLRHYEAEDLLHPGRRGQTRLFSARDRARLKLILRGRRFGFSLAEIRDLLALYDLGDGQLTQLRETRAMAREKLRVLEAQRADIDAAVADLSSQMQALDALIAAKTDAATAPSEGTS